MPMKEPATLDLAPEATPPSAEADEPPRHLGQCTGWDFNGQGVKEFFPQFYGRAPQAPKLAEQAATTDFTAEISAKQAPSA